VTNKYCGQYLSTFVKGTANIAVCGNIYYFGKKSRFEGGFSEYAT
jgi:hypothetical protein